VFHPDKVYHEPSRQGFLKHVFGLSAKEMLKYREHILNSIAGMVQGSIPVLFGVPRTGNCLWWKLSASYWELIRLRSIRLGQDISKGW
jgi:hypothetical protein